jgi:hypothetical protein
MANLIYTGEQDVYTPGIFRTIYDPTCGTGGMLSESEKFILGQNSQANLALHGQEYNDESWAICCSDTLTRSAAISAALSAAAAVFAPSHRMNLFNLVRTRSRAAAIPATAHNGVVLQRRPPRFVMNVARAKTRLLEIEAADPATAPYRDADGEPSWGPAVVCDRIARREFEIKVDFSYCAAKAQTPRDGKPRETRCLIPWIS